jgi:hypothetical protein
MNSRCTNVYAITSIITVSFLLFLVLINFTNNIDLIYAQTVTNIPDFTFSSAGDWGCNSNTDDTVNSIQNQNTELVLGLGDYSYQSTANCWLSAVNPIDEKMNITIGNHENSDSEDLNTYLNHFNMTSQYYSFDYQNIHFLSMATEIPYSSGSSQFLFVKEDLRNASNSQNIDWIVVYFHKPMYSSPNSCSASSCQGVSSLRDTYHPLFDTYGVDLVLEGHTHNYQRSFPIKYNLNNPSNPIITDNNLHNYSDPEGQIYAIVGTGGVNFHSLSGQSYFTADQQSLRFGHLNIDILNDGSTSTLIGNFIPNSAGITPDEFNITKSISSPPPPPPPPPSTEILNVVKEIGSCQATDQSICDNNPISPSDFTISVTGTSNPSPSQFPGTASPGEEVTLEEGTYQVTELGLDTTTPQTCSNAGFDGGTETSTQNVFVCTDFSIECQGTVTIGTSPGKCTITNTIVQGETPSDTRYKYEPFGTFSGTNYINVQQDSPSLKLRDSFSLGAWFKTSNIFAENGFIVNKGGLGKGNDKNQMNYGIWMTASENIQGGFETSKGSGKFITSSNTYNDNQWHYVVVTYDGSILRMYIDGSEIGNKSIKQGQGPDNTSENDLRIGANSAILDNFFIGNIDEIGVWNRTLNQPEITSLMNKGEFPPNGLVYSNSFGPSVTSNEITPTMMRSTFKDLFS